MRWGFLVTALILGVLTTAPGALARETDGFAGTPFGSSLEALPSFMKIKTAGDVVYAVNLNEPFRVAGKAPVVFYGFVQGRMFASYVRLDGIVSREQVARRLSATFGKPSLSVEGGVETLRWRTGDLKIKLKFDPTSGSLKLAYYSIQYGLPAALILPEPDAVDLDELARAYDKDKIAKGITLPKVPPTKWYSPYDDGVSTPSGRFPGK